MYIVHCIAQITITIYRGYIYNAKYCEWRKKSYGAGTKIKIGKVKGGNYIVDWVKGIKNTSLWIMILKKFRGGGGRFRQYNKY